jgi:hypothetical protein
MANQADYQENAARVLQRSNPWIMEDVIGQQTDLAYYPMVNHFSTPDTDLTAKVQSNEEVWNQYFDGDLYDTRRLTLEHFHLFEWFPLSPGKYHTQEAEHLRRDAKHALQKGPDGQSYFDPYGKANMIRGGFGSVRLRPRKINNEPHYFVSASSTGVCHEGFPVLIPREIYRNLIPRIRQDGAVPVSLSGEMRYPSVDLPTFFGRQREIPQLYLHVDDFQVLPGPRGEITSFDVSGAVSFIGEFQGEVGNYVTFATFNPASRESLENACLWIEHFYVKSQYKGKVITDFDEIAPRPHFENAKFGLPRLMAGTLEFAKIKELLLDLEIKYDEQAVRVYIDQSRQINTMGAPYVEGDVLTGGGDFIGRDKVVGYNDQPS